MQLLVKFFYVCTCSILYRSVLPIHSFPSPVLSELSLLLTDPFVSSSSPLEEGQRILLIILSTAHTTSYHIPFHTLSSALSSHLSPPIPCSLLPLIISYPLLSPPLCDLRNSSESPSENSMSLTVDMATNTTHTTSPPPTPMHKGNKRRSTQGVKFRRAVHQEAEDHLRQASSFLFIFHLLFQLLLQLLFQL